MDGASMSTLRVGLSANTIEPALTDGRLDGIGVYTNALMQGLPDVGCTVEGYSFPRPGSSVSRRQFSVSSSMPRPFPVHSMLDLFTPNAVRRSMSNDIYHATDYRVVRMSCPVVATLHDAIPLKYPEWCSPRLRGLKNWLQKKAAAKADHVIALSNFAVTELVEYFNVDEKRITVVPCGVGREWTTMPQQSDVNATLAAHGLEYGYFLFVGTLQPRKNIESILEAYLGLPAKVRRDRQLVIVGREGWRCDELVKKILAAIQNGERVVWLNDLSGEDELRHVYAAAGAFVFPSLYEGFGIPVVEAFASGVPVVTSNTTSLPEVSQGAALEIDPLSVREIGAAMLDLVQNDALRARCIAAGRRRADQLKWHHTMQQTVAVYHSVLGR
jgi:glycosyltransferase involved in cell wall biosynthesis